MRKTITAIALLALPSLALAAPSTFQKSCTGIGLGADGATINATCKKKDGTPVKASMKLQGVVNDEGKLVMAKGPTSYQKSCEGAKLNVSETAVVLSASCMTTAGESKDAKLELTGIENVDGTLKQ